jgi:alkylation response protein AidB-like acyl-CoA dehydrogenase
MAGGRTQMTEGHPPEADRRRRLSTAFAETTAEPGAFPLPGRGRTAARFEALAEVAADDLALARLQEGHADALAILSEAGRRPTRASATYGVWAARTGTGGVTATPVQGGWTLSGEKPFCSGSGMVDRALVTAEAPDGYRLFDVDTSSSVIDTVPDSWPAVGMADSASETLRFGGPVLGMGDAVGPPGFYTDRPGFWHGACGVAACWFGGARGLARGVLESVGPKPSDLVLLEIGRTAARLGGLYDELMAVAAAIDADPLDTHHRAQERALTLRQNIHRGCHDVLRWTASAGGARPLCHDRAQAQRAADLYVYLAQHHGDPDAVALGRMIVEEGRWG